MPNIEYAILPNAGLGTRLSIDKPKCLIEIDELPLILHQVNILQKIVKYIFIVVGHNAREIIDLFRPGNDKVIFVFNHKYYDTNTAYSVHSVAKYLKKGFLTIDGDYWINPEDLKIFINTVNLNPKEYHVSVQSTQTDFPCYVDYSDGRITKFTKEYQKHEMGGMLYFPGNFTLNSKKMFLYEVIDFCTPVNGILMPNCYEFDTLADLHRVKSKIDGKLAI